MKKIINTSIIYLIIGLISGVFYREYTKYYNFKGETALGNVHTHTLILGMLFFLIVSLFILRDEKILREKNFKIFYVIYNISLPLTIMMIVIRGIIQVKGIVLTKAMDASISGISGLAHILITIALILFFNIIKKTFCK